MRKKSLFYFAGIDNARFKRIVQPGDQLVIEGKFIRSKMGMGWFEAVVNRPYMQTNKEWLRR